MARAFNDEQRSKMRVRAFIIAYDRLAYKHFIGRFGFNEREFPHLTNVEQVRGYQKVPRIWFYQAWVNRDTMNLREDLRELGITVLDVQTWMKQHKIELNEAGWKLLYSGNFPGVDDVEE